MNKETPVRASQAKAIELEERLIDFAVRIVRLTAHLPQTPAGKQIAGQILRSGTSPAPNYGEAGGPDIIWSIAATTRDWRGLSGSQEHRSHGQVHKNGSGPL